MRSIEFLLTVLRFVIRVLVLQDSAVVMFALRCIAVSCAATAMVMMVVVSVMFVLRLSGIIRVVRLRSRDASCSAGGLGLRLIRAVMSAVSSVTFMCLLSICIRHGRCGIADSCKVLEYFSRRDFLYLILKDIADFFCFEFPEYLVGLGLDFFYKLVCCLVEFFKLLLIRLCIV